MFGRNQGNPRSTDRPNNGPNWRHPQGNRGGMHRRPTMVYYLGDQPSGNNRVFVHQNLREIGEASGTNHNTVTTRRSSTSSDGSNRRRNNFSNNTNRNQRGGQSNRNFQGRRYRSTDNLGAPPSDQYRDRRAMGFKALEALLEKGPEELLMELSNSKRGILEAMKTNLTEDKIVLFVKILKIVADSSFDETKYKVLQTYLDEDFVDRLKKYIAYLPVHDRTLQRKNQYFWNDPDEFWYSVIRICQNIYDSLPTFGRKILPGILKSLAVCFPSFENEHQRHISDQIKEDVNNLNEAVQALVKEYEERMRVDLDKKVNKEVEMEPPDDFRQMCVYPNAYELISGNPPFLRRNIVEGPYRDVNHYLDVQFRLLREDFVGPLRNGIEQYRTEDNRPGRKKRVENVKFYKRAVFLNPETTNEQYCVRVQFDFSKKKKNFKYENSKRFIFGSLLCFTSDNFKTILFGRVAERKLEDLENGQLIVGFDQNTAVRYKVDYLMIECSVYFEPYFHVLNVLQTMNIEDFPMEKYIIDVNPNVQPPEYLTGAGCRYVVNGYEFSPLVNFPLVNFYHLNESQLRAFRAALTQEFCIIQGPPGTGKTFLGLKIAKTLLKNEKVWYKKTPMLVICYTNHALDQFLEGLTQFTEKILRVGGQSKNENLKNYNLRNNKHKMSAAFFQQRADVNRILVEIRNLTENIKHIDAYNSIRAFSVFEDIVPNFEKTWFGRVKNKDILEWLLGGAEAVPVLNHAEGANVVQISNQIDNLQLEQNSSEEDESDDEEELDENVDVQIDDIFETIAATNVRCSVPLVTISSLQKEISRLQEIVDELKQTQAPTTTQLLDEEKFDFQLFELKNQYAYLTARLTEGHQKAMTKKEPPGFLDLRNPHNMSPNDRWNLYFYLLDLYRQKLLEKLQLLNQNFREAFKVYEEMRDIENAKAMKDVLVVGMTTTGAARLRSSLQALRSPIVIVEEAAEVLEAHIITSLTKYCKHLILIGDHQQLKPSTANYQIKRFFNLGISLFERMVINQIQLHTLKVQHRMRPEISNLIVPNIYPDLENHDSVTERPPIKGLDNCLYFIHHTHEEDDTEGTSKKNYHEVTFLIQFAKHLILNGYKPENITILAAYLGQMFEMQREKKKYKHILGDMRIAVLDNYQGEECDIILLSLVRNNKNNRIGFLSIENRVCVALSRARNGFYIMGNMDQLCSASNLWKKIRRTLENQEALGTDLPLRCQVHPDKITRVSKGEDFFEISEGGCNQKCGANLICGHKCTSICHILDRDHKDYKCREVCNKRLCDADPCHLCKKMCYSECGPCTYKVQRILPCRHTVNLECHIDPDTYNCVVAVPTKLPCGHETNKPCYCDPKTFRCPHPCEIKVEPCGHACTLLCHIRQDPDHLQYKCKKKCARYGKGCTVEAENHMCRKFCYEECDPCNVLVRKKRTVCPHLYNVPCTLNVDDLICQKPCTKTLPCGHKCKSKCYEPCGKCEIKVEKANPICGHKIKVKCCEEPDRKLCGKKCPLKLSCGHGCTKKCNQPCTGHCKEMIDCTVKAACGHTVTKIKCWVYNNLGIRQNPKLLLKYCNHPCNAQLMCGHSCSGTCGECHQGRIHMRCNEKCGFPLVCNHPCGFPCRQACRPCTLPCPYKCEHSSCSKRCGDVCTSCAEKCTRRCPHQRCSQLCGKICDVPPCTKPCPKSLRCGHPCAGLCGDPCPPKCLVCDKEELTTIFFGFEEDEDARFVLLNDCKHIFECVGLEGWMGQDDDKIGFKVCPQCKTPIKTTRRYSDIIKKAMADVSKVKKDFYGKAEEINNIRDRLQRKLAALILKQKNASVNTYCPKLDEAIQATKARLKLDKQGRRQPINKPELGAIESKLQIIEHILTICAGDSVPLLHDIYVPQVNFLMEILLRDQDHITDQEIDDVQFELNRLSRLIEYSKIKKSAQYMGRASSDQVVQVVNQIENILFGVGKFYDRNEELVKHFLKKLSRLVASGIGISEKERREIVQAMGFKQGHWYKCPNGHPYAIGDCGGAMQEAKCPECGAKIGGTHHRLLGDNAVATEMDGARHGAWSETANMANYRF